MVTDSPFTDHHVPSRRMVVLLLSIALIGLVLLAVVGQLSGGTVATPGADDPVLAPFRWVPVDGALG